MSSADLCFPGIGVNSGLRPAYAAARGTLLLTLATIYAGCIQFFITISPSLLYGTYLVISACVSVCLYLNWSCSRRAMSVCPYLLWTLAYFLWGMIVSLDALVVKEGLKIYIKNVLVAGALAIVLDRKSVRSFADLIQLAVVINFAICVWETINPSLVAELAHTREEGTTAFNVLRPAGLWSNPDEAAFAFVFAILLARWASNPLRWLGRTAALAGVYLSASRTGAYLLLAAGLVYGWKWLREHRLTSASLARLCGGAFLVGIALTAVASKTHFDVADYWQLSRMLDFTEETRDPDHASRTEIACEAFNTAVARAWYGHGLFGFQGEPTLPTVLELPAHNVFITVFGEAGILMVATYVLLLGLGLSRVFRLPLPPGDRTTLAVMWLSYLLIGLTWHNQFTSFSGMLYIALLWHLPRILATRGQNNEVTLK